MSPSLTDYWVSVLQIMSGARTRDERRLGEERQRDVAPYLDLTRPLRVLDLANGRLRPQYLLLKAEGRQVVGIDLVNRPSSNWTDRGYRVARWLYSRHIQPWVKSWPGDRLACGDVSVLPFADNTFDLVTSIAAFEHFLDVPAVVAELRRVMRPGGVAWISIHLYSSPSGGHNVTFVEIPLQTLPKGAEAWDHLRKRHLPAYHPLNEWRIPQYIEAFARHFQIVEQRCAMREGEHLLTPEIEAELAAYSRDELTCGAYVIVARKPL
jgi:SAM-dependent methyltransferase